MDNTVVISTPPHVKSRSTTKRIMIDVIISLLPCAVAGIVFFGWQALVVELTAVLSCVATEFVYYFIWKKGFAEKCKNAGYVCLNWWKQFDFTSVVTGLILALILPSRVNWYEVIIGSVFAIAIVKMLFGGTGKNLVNPAAAARVFMLLSFTVSMNVYVAANFGPIMANSVDITTGATNLSGFLAVGEGTALNPVDLLLGTGVAGCIGESCGLAIILGYIYLSVRKVIKWWQPLLFIAVFGLTATLIGGFAGDPDKLTGYYANGYTFDISLFLPHILSGGVLFAAVFMFPDYVTSPKGVWGQVVYYVAGAVLVALLQFFTKKEVASFIIMLMNLLVPLIDRYIRRKPFGYKREKKQKSVKEGK